MNNQAESSQRAKSLYKIQLQELGVFEELGFIQL